MGKNTLKGSFFGLVGIIPSLAALTIKDWFIFVTVLILFLCIIEIRRLKKALIEEIHKRLIPQLALDLDMKDIGIYLINEGSLVSQDIKIEDIPVMLEDFGFEMGFIVKFDDVESLNPNAKVKLKFKVFRRDEEVQADISGKVVLNLINTSITLIVHHSNIENIRFRSVFLRKKGKFVVQSVESYKKMLIHR